MRYNQGPHRLANGDAVRQLSRSSCASSLLTTFICLAAWEPSARPSRHPPRLGRKRLHLGLVPSHATGLSFRPALAVASTPPGGHPRELGEDVTGPRAGRSTCDPQSRPIRGKCGRKSIGTDGHHGVPTPWPSRHRQCFRCRGSPGVVWAGESRRSGAAILRRWAGSGVTNAALTVVQPARKRTRSVVGYSNRRSGVYVPIIVSNLSIRAGTSGGNDRKVKKTGRVSTIVRTSIPSYVMPVRLSRVEYCLRMACGPIGSCSSE